MRKKYLYQIKNYLFILSIQFQLQPILLFFNLSESEHKAHITVISITSLQNTNVTLIWLSELTALSDHWRTCVPRNGVSTLARGH